MGLLATWGQYSTYTDAAGKYRVIWQVPELENRIIMHKFETMKTTLEMELYFADMCKDQLFGGADRLDCEVETNVPIIINAVTYIRTHPALTLTQWNQYLNALQWYEAVTVRTFIFKLALGLAQYYGVVLDNYTEAQVLLKVRNWICMVQLNILKRVVFGYLIPNL